MSITTNVNKRVSTNTDSYINNIESLNQNLTTRIGVRGGVDQRIRMRQDKLKSLKKAILYSYQSAIVQKYETSDLKIFVDSLADIISKIQGEESFSSQDLVFLNKLEKDYAVLDRIDRSSQRYLTELYDIYFEQRSIQDKEQSLFRCLINHDKLKVDYEDKIISIPFMEAPVGSTEEIQTDFHNGTVFKWVHGNKEEWTPDTYWIVYMQYSEETAYFRAEIRKADNEIEIIVVDEEGFQSTRAYRGWITGPNETSVLWNTKKNISWNDLNYTKLLYITKDKNTLTFFNRFDRVIIDGKPWQVQAYNENYTVSKSGNDEGGIIRVALKETYTNTDNFVEETLQKIENQEQKNDYIETPHIVGDSVVKPYSILTYQAKNFNDILEWSIDPVSQLAIIKEVSQDGLKATIEIVTGKSNKQGFQIKYGDSTFHVEIGSL